MKKKVFLAAALIALMAAGAFAQAYNAESDFTVTRSGNAVTITGFVGTGSSGINISIPPTIQNTPVTAIGTGAFQSKFNLQSVIIPNGVTTIGTTAFASNARLTSVTIPGTVTSIGIAAFNNCVSLASVTFLGTIPEGGFGAQTGLDSDLRAKYLAGGPGTYTKSGTTWTLTSAAAAATTAETSTDSFEWRRTADGRGIIIEEYTSTATTVRIPDRISNLPVVEIGNGTFSGLNVRTKITSVVIPNTVTKIGNQVFYAQNELTSVTFPTGLIEIGNGAFEGCEALTGISLPASLRTIGSSAFRGCLRLTSVSLSASITTIGNNAFANNPSLTTVSVPASVTRITFGTADRASTNVFQSTNLNAASQTAVKRVGYTGEF